MTWSMNAALLSSLPSEGAAATWAARHYPHADRRKRTAAEAGQAELAYLPQ